MGRRILAQAHTASNLKEYTGKYYSPELETTYTILLEGSQLKAIHIRNPSLPLKPQVKDTFTAGEWWFGNVAFERNAQGEISSFSLEGNGFIRLRFYKTID